MRSKKRIVGIPLRLISLLFVTYTTSALILLLFGVLGGEIVATMWELKIIVLVGLFANIGACTADMIR